MGFQFRSSTARSSWAAATTQQAQLEGLRDEWAGQMSVRYYSAADAHLATVTYDTPIIDTTTTPYSLRLGAWVAESHVQDGTAAYCILAVPAGADILRCDVALAGAISDPGGRVRVDIGATLRVQATASLPAESWIPAAGYRSNINANSASAVDYDTLNPGIATADRWWNGYSQANSFGGMMGYSGSVWAPNYSANGALIVKGGGHGANIGQFCYPFNFSTRQWEQVGAPANLPADLEWAGYADYRSGIDNGLDARTISPIWYDYNYAGSYIKLDEHTYLQNAYLTPSEGGGTKGSLLLPQTSYAQNVETTDARTGVALHWSPHTFDLEDGAMVRAASLPYGAWAGYSQTIAVKDTTRSRLWYFLNGDPPTTYYHDLSGGPPFTRVAHTPQKQSGGNMGWLVVANSTWLFVPEAGDYGAFVGFYPEDSNSLPPAVPDSLLSVQVLTVNSSGFPVDQEREAAVGTQAMPFGGMLIGAAWVPASVVGGVGKFYLYEGYGDDFCYTLTPSSLNFATCTWTWGAESFANAHTGAGPIYRSTFNAANAQIFAPMGRFVFVPALECLAWHDGPGTSAECFDGVTRSGIVQLWRPPGTPI